MYARVHIKEEEEDREEEEDDGEGEEDNGEEEDGKEEEAEYGEDEEEYRSNKNKVIAFLISLLTSFSTSTLSMTISFLAGL